MNALKTLLNNLICVSNLQSCKYTSIWIKKKKEEWGFLNQSAV